MYVYFYLFTRAALARFDGAQLEAAASLGAGRWRTLTRVVLPGLAPALAAAAILTFLTALGSFSAPYIFGGSFRVMTTQILASRQNGDVDIAEVETFFLIVAGDPRPARSPAASSGGISAGGPPRSAARRRSAAPVRSPGGAGGADRGRLAPRAAAAAAAPHADPDFVRAAGDLDDRALPAGLVARQLPRAWAQPRRRCGRWPTRSGWRSPRRRGRSCSASSRRGGRSTGGPAGRSGRAPIGLLIAIPWAVPATAFAVALATTMSVHAPLSGRFLLVGTAAILPLAYLARALPATGQAAIAALEQMDPQLEEAAARARSG